MARARNIKPGFFVNDDLADIDPLGRLLFIGLWTVADREGRLDDRPRRIKAEVLPYDDCDIEALLDDLQRHQFILRYEVDGERFIQILNFAKHQNPHVKEAKSTIPSPPDDFQNIVGEEKTAVKTKGCDEHHKSTVQEQCTTQPKPEQAGLIPDSGFLIPDSGSLIPEAAATPPPRTRTREAPPAAPPADPEILDPPEPPEELGAIPDEAPRRATQIAVLLRRNGADHRIAPNDRHIADWARDGVTDAQVLQALETAKTRRQAQGSDQPIGTAYLAPIVADIRAAPPAGVDTPGRRKTRAERRADWDEKLNATIARHTGGSPREIDMGTIDATDTDR